MSSKILGSESDFFSSLAVTAALQVRTEKDGKSKCPISNIHILKSHGQSLLDSALVEGFALNCTRAAQGMPTHVKNAKIALLDFNLQKHKMQMGVQIVVTDTKQVCPSLALSLSFILSSPVNRSKKFVKEKWISPKKRSIASLTLVPASFSLPRSDSHFPHACPPHPISGDR
jgi:hypothetical protein